MSSLGTTSVSGTAEARRTQNAEPQHTDQLRRPAQRPLLLKHLVGFGATPAATTLAEGRRAA